MQTWKMSLKYHLFRLYLNNSVRHCFSLFLLCLPLEKVSVIHLNKLPSPLDALFQVWLKLAQWFWRRKFVNFINVFLLIRYYLPLKKGRALHLNKLKFPLPKDNLFGWYWHSDFWEKKENVKRLVAEGRTDGQRTTGNQKSLLKLSAQVCLKNDITFTKSASIFICQQ